MWNRAFIKVCPASVGRGKRWGPGMGEDCGRVWPTLIELHLHTMVHL